jgi:integrase
VVDCTPEEHAAKRVPAKVVAALAAVIAARDAGVSGGSSITLRAYGEVWLGRIKETLGESTLKSYRIALAHVPGALAALPLAQFRKEHFVDLAAALRKQGLSRGTVRLDLTILRALFNAAIAYEILAANPVKVKLALGKDRDFEEKPRKAFTPDELERFLATARDHEPWLYPIVYVLAYTGIRVGELQGLPWQNVNLEERRMQIARSFSLLRKKNDGMGPTKSRKPRMVDLRVGVVGVLREQRLRQAEEALRRGHERQTLVFGGAKGKPCTHQRLLKSFHRVLAKVNEGVPADAKLPATFHIHSLRHTYAIHALQGGLPPNYVMAQLGHSTIKVTMDLYGEYIQLDANERPIDRLDIAGNGSKLVTAGGKPEPDKSGKS